MRRLTKSLATLALLFTVGSAHGEYCIDWQGWLQKYAGRSGYCWATKSECESYYSSRCLNAMYSRDCAGMCYPKNEPKAGQTAAPVNGPSPEEQALQKKMQAQKKSDEAERDKLFQKDQQGLLGGMKGSAASVPANSINIKLPPASSPAGTARKQLDCVVNEARRKNPGERGPDWDNPTEGCKPVATAVPPVPEPVAVESGGFELPADPVLRAKFFAWLSSQLGQSRQNLSAADREITAREQDVAREEKSQATDKNKPASESDAMKKAREALARAKAERERIAAEMRQLEQQESAAKEKASSPSSASGGKS